MVSVGKQYAFLNEETGELVDHSFHDTPERVLKFAGILLDAHGADHAREMGYKIVEVDVRVVGDVKSPPSGSNRKTGGV